MSMKKYSNGTFSSCKGYFPVLGKFGVCIAAYGIYFLKKYMHKPKEKRRNHTQSVMYLELTNINQMEDGQRPTLACLSKLARLVKK
jgi:hypothetical protein